MPTARNWLPKFVPHDWPQRLIEARAHREADVDRNTLLIATLYYGGLRISEALSLTTHAVNLSARTIHVVGKGRKQRYIGIHPRLLALLSPWLAKLPPGAHLFPSRQRPALGRRQALNIIKRRAIAAGIDPTEVFCHLMRHGFAEHTLEALKSRDPGDALARVRDAMGHSSIAVTSIYLNVSPSRLAETFEAIE